MFTVNALERKTWKNEAKMHFSRQAQCQKGKKWPFLGSLFVKMRLGFHFWKMKKDDLTNALMHGGFGLATCVLGVLSAHDIHIEKKKPLASPSFQRGPCNLHFFQSLQAAAISSDDHFWPMRCPVSWFWQWTEAFMKYIHNDSEYFSTCLRWNKRWSFFLMFVTQRSHSRP